MMVTIGLLGGMSWESSVEYERLINQGVRARRGGSASADLIVRSYDFARIEELQASGDWDAAGELLASDARRLEDAGADLIALCTNTMHRVADRIEAAITTRFVHLADATAAAVTRSGVGRVGLLGTRYTMEEGFYVDRLRRNGLDVLVPCADDRATVHDIIYGELVRGIVTDASRSEMIAVIGRLVERGAGGVIAGCTEIELSVGPRDVDVDYFATMRIHVDALVDAALAES